MPFRKGSAGSCLEITFKCGSALAVTKCNGIFDYPRLELGSMRHLTFVMRSQPVSEIVGQTDVKVLWILNGLQNVNVVKPHGGLCLADFHSPADYQS